MDETDCIVCFANYDDENHRPRIMPCGHTNCSECLEKAIAGNSKICPKCRTPYTASDVKELIINFSLESLVKSINLSKDNKVDSFLKVTEKQSSSETNKSDSLPECAEHQLTVSDRCTTHKAWVCKSCLEEDHSTEACQIITISEELDVRKQSQLDRSQSLLNDFDESCKNSDDCKKQCKKFIEENDEEIIKAEALVKKLQEEIKGKKTHKIEMEKNFATYDEKMEITKSKKKIYDHAVTFLKSSTTIRAVSKCSIEVQNEAKTLQQISKEIDIEIEQMLQTFKPRKDSMIGLSLGNHKLSVSDGMTHLHAMQAKNTSASPSYNIKFSGETDPQTTDGILTFLDIAWPGQEPRRVYIKMNGNTARARQHLLLVTGQCGQSYKDLDFRYFNNLGQPEENIIISPYDGKRADPLLEDVTINDGVVTGIKAGVVTSAFFSNKNRNNALFGICLTDIPGSQDRTCFGFVTSGLDVLKELARSKKRAENKIVDCGVVLF